MLPTRLSEIKCIYPALIALLLTLMAVKPGVCDTAETQELMRKTADIALLENQLGDRQQQAHAVLVELNALKDRLQNEIRILEKSYHIDGLDQAVSHARLAYDLKLMQQILAYSQAFEDKIQFYRVGKDKLLYLHALVQDDLKMSTALDHYAIDALTTQISMLINKYMAEAHIIQIDTANLAQPSLEQVWESLHQPDQH